MLLKKQKRKNGKQNRKSGKYGQVKLRASRRGIYSCLFALGCIICLAILIYVAYITYGEAPAFVGSIGFTTMMNAGLGIYYGIAGFRERERSYLLCKLGIFLNGFIIVSFILLFARGLF